MKRFFLAFAVLTMAVFSSCSNEPAKTEVATTSSFNLDSAKAAINASNMAYGECFATGDSTRFAACYTSDACINPPNMPRMCGTQAITAFFNGGYQMGIRNIKLTMEEVMGGENTVAETGKYELMGDKGASLDKGKYIVVWKMDNGKWKMYRDVWNSDMPATPPPPAPKK